MQPLRTIDGDPVLLPKHESHLFLPHIQMPPLSQRECLLGGHNSGCCPREGLRPAYIPLP